MVRMKTILLVAAIVMVVSVFNLPAAGTPAVADLAGEWHGDSRFTGISYDEYLQKKVHAGKVAIVLKFSKDGKVSGSLGGAEFNGSVTEAHRGWFWHLLGNQSNFLIEGKLVGAVAAGSDAAARPLKLPITFAGGQITGDVFAVYPIKYPYPFLNLRLSR
jgi:hypothetical protein